MSSSEFQPVFHCGENDYSWLHLILENLPDSLYELCSEIVSYYEDGDNPDYFPCPDEIEWFRQFGFKFDQHCHGVCELCIAQFLLDPKAYEYTRLGGIDPFKEVEKQLAI